MGLTIKPIYMNNTFTMVCSGPYTTLPFAYPPIQRIPFAFYFLMAPAFSRLDGRTHEPMRLNSSPAWMQT